MFVMRGALPVAVQRSLTGFAAGVMAAASIWSLLVPVMEQAADLGKWAFAPAAGFWLGILFPLALDRLMLSGFLPEAQATREQIAAFIEGGMANGPA